MATIAVVNHKNEKVSEVELPEEIYRVPVRIGLLHEVVRWQMARWRAGSACTKTRGEVRGGGRKPWRQKGTGRARQGSIRAPQWVGGGVVFGPKPRDYSFKLNKKQRRLALKMALSARVREGKLVVVEDFGLSMIKTKDFIGFLEKIGIKEDVLIVVPERDEIVEKSARNIPAVKVLAAEGLNVYDILDHEYLIIKRDALPKIKERLLK